jgi:hypothetical protein
MSEIIIDFGSTIFAITENDNFQTSRETRKIYMGGNCSVGDGICIHDNSPKQRITVTTRQEFAKLLGMPGRKLAGHLEVAPCMLDCGSVEVRWPSCTAGGHFTRP